MKTSVFSSSCKKKARFQLIADTVTDHSKVWEQSMQTYGRIAERQNVICGQITIWKKISYLDNYFYELFLVHTKKMYMSEGIT